jgi:hypothetical protein
MSVKATPPRAKSERVPGSRLSEEETSGSKLSEASAADLGLSTDSIEFAGKLRRRSKIIELLGNRMVPVKLVEVPGRILWVDFELARELGFSVPKDNRLTPELRKELLEALSFRVLQEGEDPAGRRIIDGCCDLYQGTGQKGHPGAARAAFLPVLNALIKGSLRTPIAAPLTTEKFAGRHGGAPAREGLLEAVWGLVSNNLFTHGGTRILAVIDVGDDTPWPSGWSEPRALCIRVGNQYRLAHLLATAAGEFQAGDMARLLAMPPEQGFQGAEFTPGLFVEMAREGGFLVEKGGEPDLHATMLEAIDRQALQSAEQFRFRVLHGAVSTSNTEWDGGPIDHGTTDTVSRTEPAKIGDHHPTGFGGEHLERASQLELTYREIQRWDRAAHPDGESTADKTIDFQREMKTRYEAHMTVQMLCAAGLKLDVARAFAKAEPELTHRFSGCLRALGALSNVESVNVNHGPAPWASTVDIFNMLRELPNDYLANPGGDHCARIRELLMVQGWNTAPVDGLVGELNHLYSRIMIGSLQRYANVFYEGDAAMKRSIIARAQFENAPMTLLERSALGARLDGAIREFRESWGQDDKLMLETGSVREVVDKLVAASVRSVDRLLRQGTMQPLSHHGLELERRTIDGIDYAVRAWPDGRRRLHLSMPVVGDEKRGYAFPTLRVNGIESPHVTPAQLKALTYKFTRDDWESWLEVKAELTTDEAGRTSVHFDIPAAPSEVGLLEGLFHCTAGGDFYWHDGMSNFRGYTFAVPDRHDLEVLTRDVATEIRTA